MSLSNNKKYYRIISENVDDPSKLPSIHSKEFEDVVKQNHKNGRFMYIDIN